MTWTCLTQIQICLSFVEETDKLNLLTMAHFSCLKSGFCKVHHWQTPISLPNDRQLWDWNTQDWKCSEDEALGCSSEVSPQPHKFPKLRISIWKLSLDWGLPTDGLTYWPMYVCSYAWVGKKTLCLQALGSSTKNIMKTMATVIQLEAF